MVSLKKYYEPFFEEYVEYFDHNTYDDGDVWDEDISNNWNYWKTRWNKVKLDQREELEDYEDSDEVEMDKELKEHQIYYLGLPEDIQKKIFNLVNPIHNYVYSS